MVGAAVVGAVVGGGVGCVVGAAVVGAGVDVKLVDGSCALRFVPRHPVMQKTMIRQSKRVTNRVRIQLVCKNCRFIIVLLYQIIVNSE